VSRISALAGVAAIALMAGMTAVIPAHAQNRAAEPQFKPRSPAMSDHKPAPGRDMQSNDMRGRSGDTQERTSRSTTANAAEVRGSADVSIETFQEKLRPVGEFVDVRDLGQVWKPRDVNNDWKPYSNGRWIFNQKVGWYFESDEPWAEITYHYGR